MSTHQVNVRGTIKPDGSLELEEKLPLPPGHVQVSIQPDEPPTSEDWWQYLQRSRAELEAAGAGFRSGEEIDAFIEQVRGESERVDAYYWETEWRKHHDGNPPC